MNITLDQEKIDYTKSLIDVRIGGGKYSTLFLQQTAIALYGRIFDVFSMFDEVEYLEGRRPSTRTKKESRFRGENLNGLWHKHFSDARFLLHNIKRYWGIETGKFENPDSDQSRRFDKTFQEIARQAERIEDEDKQYTFQTNMPFDLFVMSPFRCESWNLTGEWVVFAKRNDSNYYLTIATHKEDDRSIKERINTCLIEFPELLDVIKNDLT